MPIATQVHDSVSQSQALEQPVDEGGPLVEQVRVEGVCDKKRGGVVVVCVHEVNVARSWEFFSSISPAFSPLSSLASPLPHHSFSLSLTHPTQFTATEPVSKEEAVLFSLLQHPHIKALIESHDMVKDRKYLPQVPVMDTPFYPTNTTKTTEGLQQRTVGLYKEPDQPLVRVEGGDGVRLEGDGVRVEGGDGVNVDSTPSFLRVLPSRWWMEKL